MGEEKSGRKGPRELGKTEPSRAAVRAYRWRVVRFALVLTLLVTPVLAISYGSRSPERGEFLALVAVVALSPVLSAVASMLSGECVARGAPVVPVAVQAMRSFVPAVLLLAWPSAPLWLVAAALPAGELIRGAILLASCRRLRSPRCPNPSRPPDLRSRPRRPARSHLRHARRIAPPSSHRWMNCR